MAQIYSLLKIALRPTLATALSLASSSVSLAATSESVNSRIARISRAGIETNSYRDMRELFELTEKVMISKRLYDFVNSLTPLQLAPPQSGLTEDPKKRKRLLTTTQVLFILDHTREFWPRLNEYVSKVTDENAEQPEVKKYRAALIAEVSAAVAEKQLDAKLAPLNSPAQPLVMRIKGQPDSYSGLSIFVNQPSLSDPSNENSALIAGDDLRQVLVDFIDSAKKEIYGNFFENNLPEVSAALLRAKKRGVKVLWGMDKNTTQLAPENIAFLELMQAHESDTFKAVLVDPVGLNHQKMVVKDPQEANAALLQSSGNNTQSCIGPEGDMKNFPVRDPRSIPNANHTLVIKGQLPALVGEFQLRKNLLHGIRGEKSFPIDGSYMLPGPVARATGNPNFVILAYSPNGGMGDVNKSLLVPVIRRTTGRLWTMQFAFSSPDVVEAISQRILDSQGSLDFRSFGDPPFAMQPWSGFLRLSGLLRSETKVYSQDAASPLVLGLKPERLAELRSKIRINRKMFGEYHLRVNGEAVKVTAKQHHKVWVFPDDDMSIVGTSFNVSDGAETNQENLALVRDPNVTNRIGGALMWLWSNPDSTSVLADSLRRNSSQQAGDDDVSPESLEARQELARGSGARSGKNAKNCADQLKAH